MKYFMLLIAPMLIVGRDVATVQGQETASAIMSEPHRRVAVTQFAPLELESAAECIPYGPKTLFVPPERLQDEVDAVTIRYDPLSAIDRRTRCRMSAALHSVSSTISFDDDVISELANVVDVSLEFSALSEFESSVTDSQAGVPRTIVRTYGDANIAGEFKYELTSSDAQFSGDFDVTNRVLESAIVFDYDESLDRYDVAFKKGSKKPSDLQQAVFNQLSARVDGVVLLPSGPVEVGDEWSIEDTSLGALFVPFGDPSNWFFPHSGTIEGQEFADLSGCVAIFRGEASARFSGNSKRSGRCFQVIEFTFSGTVTLELSDFIGPIFCIASGTELDPGERLFGPLLITADVEMDGEMLWDDTLGIMFELTSKSDVTVNYGVVVSLDGDREGVKVGGAMEGVIAYSLSTPR